MSQHAGLLRSVCVKACCSVSDWMWPEAQDRERPAVLAQQESDLIVVGVRVKWFVVLFVLHLVFGGLSALSDVTRLRGRGLGGALLPPLGPSVLKPYLTHKWCGYCEHVPGAMTGIIQRNEVQRIHKSVISSSSQASLLKTPLMEPLSHLYLTACALKFKTFSAHLNPLDHNKRPKGSLTFIMFLLNWSFTFSVFSLWP